ncbi:MAG: hypothetical protein ACI310_05815 [Bacilli bacterium]
MGNNIYADIKSKLLELNRINDEVNLLEWNKDDGPKFDSVDEMKEFERKVINGELDYIFNEEKTAMSGEMIKTEEITKDDYFFYIYTFKNDNKFITYMSIKNLINNDVLQNLYGNKTTDKEQALSYNEKLKNDIINNTLNYIFENIIVDINNNISNLKKKYEELTSIS